jgi:hypothetical protein
MYCQRYEATAIDGNSFHALVRPSQGATQTDNVAFKGIQEQQQHDRHALALAQMKAAVHNCILYGMTSNSDVELSFSPSENVSIPSQAWGASASIWKVLMSLPATDSF